MAEGTWCCVAVGMRWLNQILHHKPGATELADEILPAVKKLQRSLFA